MQFSVLMSVYSKDNPDNFRDALISVWDDQNLKPDQIVLVVDGPISIELHEVINDFSCRLKEIFVVIFNRENIGLAKSLNIGLASCKFPFVARMDSDDISLPDRFSQQFGFLSENPHIDCLGGSIIEYNYDLSVQYSKIFKPVSHLDLIKYSKFRCPFNHPTVVFRKTAVVDSGGYPSVFPEDYTLWINMILNGCVLANIDLVVLKMRTGTDFLYRRGFHNAIGMVKTFRHMYYKGFIGFFNFLLASFLHFFVRVSPVALKSFFYRKFR